MSGYSQSFRMATLYDVYTDLHAGWLQQYLGEKMFINYKHSVTFDI